LQSEWVSELMMRSIVLESVIVRDRCTPENWWVPCECPSSTCAINHESSVVRYKKLIFASFKKERHTSWKSKRVETSWKSDDDRASRCSQKLSEIQRLLRQKPMMSSHKSIFAVCDQTMLMKEVTEFSSAKVLLM
jgi:hypothetical protein